MLDHIRNLLGLSGGPWSGADNPGGGEQESFEARRLAAAALLVEAARQDGDYADSERDKIAELLATQFSLSRAAALRLLTQGEEAQAAATDLFRFTNTVLAEMDEAERIALVEMLWQVVLADGRIHDFEASLMRRVAGLLHVSDYASAKARTRAKAGADK